MSLKRPEQKMSKSDPDPKSRILITDSPEEIHAKLRGAVTDSHPGISFDPEHRPGVSNLINILKHVSRSQEPSEYIAKDNANVSMRAFKEMIADEIIKEFRDIRDNFMAIMDPKNNTLRQQVEDGAAKARRQARMTLADVQRALGLTDLAQTDGELAYRRQRRRQIAQKEAGAHLAVEPNPFQDEDEQGKLKEDSAYEDEYGVDEEDLVKGDTLESIRRGTK